MARNVVINDVEFNFDELSKDAQSLIANIRGAEQEIAHLNRLLALAQTARAAYGNALQPKLPVKAEEKKEAKK